MLYRQLNNNGKGLQYQCEGEGPAVVLLHGFGEDSAVWRFQKVLGQHFKLLIPDLPGSGASDQIADMSLEGMAEIIPAMLQQEGIEKCILIGHSMGGYIALAFAEKYSHLLNGLGLFHSSAFTDSDEKKATRRKGIAFMQEHGAFAFLKTTAPNLYSPATKETAAALIDEQLATVIKTTNAAAIAYYEAMMARPDRTAVLQQLPVPALFVLGKWDTAVPLHDGFAQCHLPQTSFIKVLSHSGHMGLLEEQEESTVFLHHYLSETAGLL